MRCLLRCNNELFCPGSCEVRLMPLPLKVRVPLTSGWAEAYCEPPLAVIGDDRRVPRRVDVHFESVDGQPSLDLLLEVVDGIPQCREVRVKSTPDGREVKPLD